MPEKPTPKNAVALLVDLLESLTVPANKSAERTYGFERSDEQTDTWHRYVESLNLVRNVEAILDGMTATGRDVDIFRGAVRRSWLGVGMASNPWGSTAAQNRPAANPQDLAMLRALALLVDATGALTLDEDDRRRLADILEEADTLLTEDSSVPADIRVYIRSLVTRARMLLENLDTFGAEAVRSAAMELGGAMVMQAQRAAASGDKPTGRRWLSGAHMVMAGFMGGLGGDAAAAAFATGGEALKQLLG